MPHGGPDYGASAAKTTIYNLQDMAELAARLGSIVTFDRLGDVVWLEDFEGNLGHWTKGCTDVTGDPAISTTRSRNGAQACLFQTGGLDPYRASISRYIARPVQGKIGLELSFSVPQAIYALYQQLTFQSSTLYYTGLLRHLISEEKAQILVPGPAWQDIATALPYQTSEVYFHTAKLVVDCETGKYSRAVIDSHSYDLSEYSMRSQAPVTEDCMLLSISAYALDSTRRDVYIDDVIVTQNEP